ncbi:MAG TPA: hypothetical protein VEQ11_21725, partial [Chloroflexota bacterium]|nr:hypothetical protein [Chloroflexota bacterium]
MRQFARDYDHCFLGNGTDGVLVGYTGAMVPERVNAPERCVWYKSDRYHPPERPARPVPHRHYRKEVTRVPRPDDAWFELAPLGRSWYELLDEDSRACEVVSSTQELDPLIAVLRSAVRYPSAAARVTTFLHAHLPLLVVRCRFDREVHLRACLSPGPWAPSEDEPDPFTELAFEPGEVARARYRLGSLAGEQALWLDAPSELSHLTGRTLCVELPASHSASRHRGPARSRHIGPGCETRSGCRLRRAPLGALLHLACVSGSLVGHLPDHDLQRLHDAGLSLFRAIQSPESGGIPVGLLRQTWSSHLFWDSYFPTRALLE